MAGRLGWVALCVVGGGLVGVMPTDALATGSTHARPAPRQHHAHRKGSSHRVAVRQPSAVSSVETAGGAWSQTGLASWYGGRRWMGNRTATGEVYDESALTAAHATLPLGSRVRVTLCGTDRAVDVLINDRPGSRTRVIDLSRAAAVQLGMLNRGLATVALSRL